MNDKELKKIRIDNWKKIKEVMALRQKQFEDIYQGNGWEYLIKDELYKFLCQKLTEIKLMGRPTHLLTRELSDEDIKSLASGFVSVKDFMEIEDIDLADCNKGKVGIGS